MAIYSSARLFKYIKVILLWVLASLISFQIWQTLRIVLISQLSIMRKCISLVLQRLIYNLKLVKRMVIQYFLLTNSIDKIKLCTASIKVDLSIIVFYLIYFNVS